jgi:chemotaxis response regulator CheB
VRVLLADDDVRFRAAVARVLVASHQAELVATAGDAETAVARYRELRPDVVLLGETIEAAPAILAVDPGAVILTLTTRVPGRGAAGARGVLKKDAVTLVPLLLQLVYRRIVSR